MDFQLPKLVQIIQRKKQGATVEKKNKKITVIVIFMLRAISATVANSPFY